MRPQKKYTAREFYVSESAIATRIAKDADHREREAKAKEDQYWRAAEGPKTRAAKKREEQAEKRAEAAAKKAEARRLAEQEEEELVGRRQVYKVTRAELLIREEETTRWMEEKEKKQKSRVLDQDEYLRMVNVENVNRGGFADLDASSVDGAIRAMVMEQDKQPRHNALFDAFVKAELPGLKKEKPGLTHNQYQVLVQKQWKKSLDIPEVLGMKVRTCKKNKAAAAIVQPSIPY